LPWASHLRADGAKPKAGKTRERMIRETIAEKIRETITKKIRETITEKIG
jgi:hypothetical protein